GHRDAAYLAELMARERVTTVHFVPSMLSAFLGEGGSIERCTSLRRVVCSGEALSSELAEQFYARSSAELYNLYGPTEAAVDVTWWRCERKAERRGGGVPIGRPIANTKIYLLDGRGEPVPVGVAGELYIGGVALARGYWERPEMTAERFVPDAFSGEAGARLYRTGDVARYGESGEVEYLGRTDTQVKVRGFRIELGEVEAALRGREGVREAAVIVREGAGGDRRLVAYVVFGEGAGEVTVGEWREYLGERLPEYMIPSAFVTLDALPLTPSGKLDRKALPEAGVAQAESEFVAPRTATEEVLAGIWAEVLRVERVGVEDNFFELGGDSILSMHVVARANRLGLSIVTRQIFQHQTIAALAEVAGETTQTLDAEQATVLGPLPLTPIQNWFFESETTDPHHWNQAVMLEADERLDAVTLHHVLSRLLEHHDALRLRFMRGASGWQQVCAGTGGVAPFTQIDLSALDADEQRAMIQAAARQAQGGLDLTRGPLVRVVLFDLGEARPCRLLVVIHHLAVDAVSWRFLLEDLRAAYEQLRAGAPVALPPKTSSYKRWAEHLATYAQSPELRQELPYWTDERRREVASLPLDYSLAEGANIVAFAQTVAVSLDAEETRALLQDVPKAFRTQIDDVLLTALAVALARWTGTARVLFDLERHGREETFEGVDLSRTVGWFTSLFPVLLEPGESGDLIAALRSVKEQLSRIPQRGIGYGLLRYLSGDEEAQGALRSLPQAEVLFNYLGQFDEQGTEREANSFRRARESSGLLYSPRGERRHLLEVTGSVGGGCLHLHWHYGGRLHSRATIENLAQEFVSTLRLLIGRAHADGGAHGYVPSDFPLAKLDGSRLEQLLAGRGRVEDIYPLSPLQQGLLFHSLYQPQSEVYIIQLGARLRGRLDVAAFERAWAAVVERHSVLRTSFVWEELDEPLQIVEQRVSLAWERLDWRALPAAEQQVRLEELLVADRRQGFRVARAPLMRLTLVQVGEDEYEFVWSQHHLLLDGWSMPIVLGEVVAYYEAYRRGRTLELAPVRPYRDYIEWLGRQDEAEAAAFWRKELAGFERTPRLRIERATAAGGEGAAGELFEEQQMRVGRATSEALSRMARRHQLTMNTVLEGAWSLLLSHYSGAGEVVFGATLSGRPAALAGVETMTGMFINTLPVRVPVERAAHLADWLRELQTRQAGILQFEQTPLVNVQAWAGTGRGAALFDTIMTFENYPMPASLAGEEDGGAGRVEVVSTRYTTKTHYGLTLLVQPGDEIAVKILYDARRFEAESVAGLLELLGLLLGEMHERADATLGELLAVLEEAERERRRRAESEREESKRKRFKSGRQRSLGA
ncbi:MAG: condensation domain-containing protein, partial [Pyrinomonadaceae bacterium]